MSRVVPKVSDPVLQSAIDHLYSNHSQSGGLEEYWEMEHLGSNDHNERIWRVYPATFWLAQYDGIPSAVVTDSGLLEYAKKYAHWSPDV